MVAACGRVKRMMGAISAKRNVGVTVTRRIPAFSQAKRVSNNSAQLGS
jgi:hypothetical protein